MLVCLFYIKINKKLPDLCVPPNPDGDFPLCELRCYFGLGLVIVCTHHDRILWSTMHRKKSSDNDGHRRRQTSRSNPHEMPCTFSSTPESRRERSPTIECSITHFRRKQPWEMIASLICNVKPKVYKPGRGTLLKEKAERESRRIIGSRPTHLAVIDLGRGQKPRRGEERCLWIIELKLGNL